MAKSSWVALAADQQLPEFNVAWPRFWRSHDKPWQRTTVI